MNKKQLTNRLKTIVTSIALSCLGILIAVIIIEMGLHLLPRNYLTSVIERSTRLQLYRLDPRIGWSLKPNARSVHITRDDVPIPIQINSLGLRDTEHAYRESAGTYRILMLGDSFTEALDVTLEQSFPHVVEQCLNQQLNPLVEVINTGVSGYGPAEQYLFYTNEGVKYDPDLVLLIVYVGNDFSDLDQTDSQRMVRGFGGYRFTINNGGLSKTWISWENPLNEKVSPFQLFLRRHSILYRVLSHPESKVNWSYGEAKEELLDWLGDDNVEYTTSQPVPWNLYIHVQDFPNNPIVPTHLKKIWSIFQAIISQLHTQVETNHSQLAVVIIPTEYQVHPTVREDTTKRFASIYDFAGVYEKAWRTEEPNLTVTQYLEVQRIPTLDLLPYFQAHDKEGGSLLYFDGGYPQHLNKDGQRLMGDLICEWLVRNESIRLPRP